jgi:plastocyanin
VNDCDDFTDRTADGDSRDITWDFSITAAPERCMKVRAGQTVTWSGDLTAHPLAVDGVEASDVKLVGPGAQVTFTTAGTFGFNCVLHAEMKGAILVE